MKYLSLRLIRKSHGLVPVEKYVINQNRIKNKYLSVTSPCSLIYFMLFRVFNSLNGKTLDSKGQTNDHGGKNMLLVRISHISIINKNS